MPNVEIELTLSMKRVEKWLADDIGIAKVHLPIDADAHKAVMKILVTEGISEKFAESYIKKLYIRQGGEGKHDTYYVICKVSGDGEEFKKARQVLARFSN